jgi:hypothetical protein
VRPVTAEEAVDLTPALVRVYHQAFGGPGYDETEEDVARSAEDG